MNDTFAHKSHNWDNPTKVGMTQRFVKEIVEKNTLAPHDRLLELGCGTGLVGLQLAPLVAELVMVDNSPAMLAKLREKLADGAHPNVSALLGEASSYTGERVDCILSFMALHHMEDTEGLLATAFGLLRSGGRLIVGDLEEEDSSFHRGEAVPHSGFNLEQLATLARRQGFIDVQISLYDAVAKNERMYPLFILRARRG